MPGTRMAVCVAGGWLLVAPTLPAAGSPADVWVKEVKVRRNAPKR
jgi:hypothetical protein